MTSKFQIFDRSRLLITLSILLSAGFFATALFSYFVSKEAIRSTIIGQDLPLTSSNIYSEIQKDLVRPVLISSTMAHDTFVRDWVLRGEADPAEMARYLREVKERHGAFSSFFVSEKTGNYYTGDGVFKQVRPDEPRDAWYYRVRDLKDDYEINVDPDLANRDALTIFINYRVFDFAGNYIGATGIGLTVDAVRELVATYQRRFNRTVYFADVHGKIVLFGGQSGRDLDLRKSEGIAPLVDRILQERSGSYTFVAGGDSHILNVNYLPELKWYLFVEQNEDLALLQIRRTLLLNLVISLLVTVVVIVLTHLALRSYHRRIETMATTDKLTGLLNRHAFAILLERQMVTLRRAPAPMSLLLLDIDHFKKINDHYGHRAGDQMLVGLAGLLRSQLRESDLPVRWGGEEFLILLPDCDQQEASRVAEKLRVRVAEASLSLQYPDFRITISIGVSQFDGAESADRLISRADKALYAAKDSGRNAVCLAEA
jgi:diguanylate cyclase (GGDEF)-like protein